MRKSNVQLSPCIISQVRYELGLKKTKPENSKKCSEAYRERVREFVKKKIQREIAITFEKKPRRLDPPGLLITP